MSIGYVKLTWPSINNQVVQGYRVYKSTQSFDSPPPEEYKAEELSPSVNEWLDEEIENDTYFYMIEAFSRGAESQFSSLMEASIDCILPEGTRYSYVCDIEDDNVILLSAS